MRKNVSSTIKLFGIIVLSIIALTLLGVFALMEVPDKAFMLEEQVLAAKSDISVQEQRRVDTIINLADCVKSYNKHEAETLVAIAEGRNTSKNIEEASLLITKVSEAYPELKSQENYNKFMNELIITENLIAEYRSNYNKQVKVYNRYIKKYSNKIFLNMFNYEYQDYEYLNYDAPVSAPTNLFD